MWYTQIKIKADRSAIDTLESEFIKATKECIPNHSNNWAGNLALHIGRRKKDTQTDTHKYWTGNLTLHIGRRKEDTQTDTRKYYGIIFPAHREGRTFTLNTYSDKYPSVLCIEEFVNAFVKDAQITYTAQEDPEKDTLKQRLWTNDPDVAGTVCIDWFEELPEDLEDLLLKLQETSQEHVERELSGFLGQEGTLDELRRALEDRYDKVIVFNTYKYISIKDTLQD